MNKLGSFILTILIVLMIPSLILNAASIAILMQARDVALEEVDNARALVANVRDTTISYTVEINQDIPVKTSIPFEQEVLVPVNTTIPINTSVIVPIDAGPLGKFDITVPIIAAIPIALDIAVPISKTIDIDTTVPLQLQIPVTVPLSETPLAEHLDTRNRSLDRLERFLQDPFNQQAIISTSN
jgi:hypothetical protein